MNNRGQISWLWATMVAGFSLAAAIGFYIILNNSQTGLATVATTNPNLDTTTHTTIQQIITLIPFAILASFGIYVWVIASATRGGDAI